MNYIRNRFQNIFEQVSSQQTELKDRLSVVFLLTGFFLSFVPFTIGSIMGRPFYFNIPNLVVMILCLAVILNDKYPITDLTIYALYFVAYVFFPCNFYLNGGNVGPMPFYFVMIVVYFAFYLEGKRFKVVIGTVSAYYIAIMISAYIHPEFILVAYNARMTLIFNIVAYLSIGTVMGVIAKITFKGYEHERNIILELNHEILLRNDELEHLSIRDQLTSVYNRRYFLEKLHEQREKASHEEAIFLMMIDIDDFKMINDKYGHLYGDEILKLVSNAIKTSIRDHDIVARYGGEEFIVMLSYTDKGMAHQIAERIRINIAEIEYRNEKITTVSIGVTEVKSHGYVNAYIDQADTELYKAKDLGKNRVCVNAGVL